MINGEGAENGVVAQQRESRGSEDPPAVQDGKQTRVPLTCFSKRRFLLHEEREREKPRHIIIPHIIRPCMELIESGRWETPS